MSHRRTASAADIKPRKSRRSIDSAPVKWSRTMADLSRERIDRLQLLAILPDDVLGMVNEMLSFDESPVMAALGRPFSNRLATPEYETWVESRMTTQVSDSYVWAHRMHTALPPAESIALCRRMRKLVPKIVEHRCHRAKMTAALQPTHTNAALRSCDSTVWTFAALCAGDLDKAVEVSGSTTALHIAVQAGMYELVPKLIAPPYYATPNCYDYVTLYERPNLCRMYASSLRLSTQSAIDMFKAIVQLGHVDMLDVLLTTSSHLLNVDACLVGLSPSLLSEQKIAMMCTMVERVPMSSQTCSLAIARAVSMACAWLIESLEKHPHSPFTVVVVLSKEYGALHLSSRYLERITSAEDALTVLNLSRCTRDAATEIEFMQTLPPVFRAQLPASEFASNLFHHEAVSMTLKQCQQLFEFGARIYDYPAVMNCVARRGHMETFQYLLDQPDLTDADVGLTLTNMLRKPGGYMSALGVGFATAVLKTGRVNSSVLITALAELLDTPDYNVRTEIRDHYSAHIL